MDHTDIKTFRDLQQEVVNSGLCVQCAGCVSFCSAGRLNALQVGEDGFPRFADENNCVVCGICYMICPETKDLEGEVRERFGWQAPIGLYRSILSARATDSDVRAVATDGGVVTALLTSLLDRHLIDGAIISRTTGPFTREALVATTREEIAQGAGSSFGSYHLDNLGDAYSTYSPTISAVKSLQSRHLHTVAVVGTPCQIRAIRKMQTIGVVPSHIIRYSIGLFCTENLAFHATGRANLEALFGASLDEVTKLNLKEDVIVTLRDGRVLHVPFDELTDVARPACLACMDLSNEYADISAGGLGSLSGYTTVLIRSRQGERAFNEAVRGGYVEERVYESAGEMRSEKTKMMAKVVAFAQGKRERGEERRGRMSQPETSGGGD